MVATSKAGFTWAEAARPTRQSRVNLAGVSMIRHKYIIE